MVRDHPERPPRTEMRIAEQVPIGLYDAGRDPHGTQAHGEGSGLPRLRGCRHILIEKIGVLPTLEGVGKARVLRPCWLAEYSAQGGPFGIMAHRHGDPAVWSTARIAPMGRPGAMTIADAAWRASINRIVEHCCPQHTCDRLAMWDVNVLALTALATLPQRQQRRQSGMKASHGVRVRHGKAQRRTVSVARQL